MDFFAFLIFFLVLAGSIFIHELGHFIAARMAKIEVEEFGFGLPPKALTLFKWQGTEFTLNWIPLGGFVRPKGENDPNVPDGLSAANPWKRLGVLFAGPIMNLLTAIIVFAIIVSLSGVAIPGVVNIADIQPESPASEAGFAAGDIILAVNGTQVSQIAQARGIILDNLGQPVSILIERNGQQQTIVATPLSTRVKENQGALGIILDAPRRPATLVESLTGGVVLTGMQAVTILSIPVMLIQGAIAPGEARMVGLVGMFDMFSQAVERDTETRQQVETASAGSPAPSPTNYTLSLIAMLSVSLGVFNLLPIPALDGGRILFTLPEILFRRRIPYRFENVVNGVAFLLLIGLMIFVNLMDVLNPSNFQLP